MEPWLGFLLFGLSSIVSSFKYHKPSGDFPWLHNSLVSIATDIHYLQYGQSSWSVDSSASLPINDMIIQSVLQGKHSKRFSHISIQYIFLTFICQDSQHFTEFADTSASGHVLDTYTCYNGSVEYFGSEHMPYAILATTICIVFNIANTTLVVLSVSLSMLSVLS